MPAGEASGAVGARLGEPGQVVDGRYRLEQLLGAGGFGEVWRATQEVEGSEVRPVALKLVDAPSLTGADTPALRATPSGSGGSLGAHRWLDEVRAVRDIKCDSITTIYDVGIARENRLAFIAMELLEGQTLHDRIAPAGRIYWRRALWIARQIASALVACHAVGVSHCDLKPQNVFLAAGGRVYVLDFGIAALGPGGQAPPSAGAADPSEMFAMGATGAVDIEELPGAAVPAGAGFHVFGTPGYIAPESYLGEPPGPASDVFALGVVLYRMLAGAMPQKVDTGPIEQATTAEEADRYYAAISSATAAGEFVPLDQRAEPPPIGIRRLVTRMLSSDPADRPTGDLLAALDEVARRPHGVPDPPYVGLAAFDDKRAGYIAGRDGDIEDVTGKLRDHRAVVLVGPSGCGKSSLAIAGVAPRIDEELLLDLDGWTTVLSRPSFGAGELHLPRAGDRDRTTADARLGTVVVVDQLEELVRLDDDDRIAYCEALATLVEGSGPVVLSGRRFEPDDPVRLIATCRDDLFGQVASLPELRRFPERNLYTVRGVEPNAMADIVEGPARAAGYRLEIPDQVVAEAVRIVSQDSGALPLVQFALTRWWEGRDRDRKLLPGAVWQEIGGIEGALAEAAQTLYDGLGDGERGEMRSLLLAMFRPDGTRVRVDEARVVSGAEGRAVLGKLVDRRLVTRHTGDGERGATLEVVHEALGRAWPRLHAWLEETRSERELIHDVHYDAERWRKAGEPSELLWRGGRLDDAARVIDRLGDDAAFIEASVAAAGKQAWRRRGFAGLLAAVVAVAVVMVLSYLASNQERERAKEAQAVAEKEREKAVDARREAEVALGRNIELRNQAEQARSAALAEQRRAEEEKRKAEAARKQALAEADKNAELRRVAETAEGVAQRAMKQAQIEKQEADRQRQRNRDQAARAEMQLREVTSKLRHAETAKRLHELARKRLEAIERRYGSLQREYETLEKRLEQCRAGATP
jgi:serine/threonine protein kinase